MSRTKLFFYNSLSTVLLRAAMVASGFIVPRYMLLYYGSAINGLVSSIMQFIAYFNLVEAGLAGATVYALYKPLAERNYRAISGVVSAARRYYIQSGAFFVVLVTILAFVYPLYIKSEAISSLKIFLLVIILGANGCLEFFTLAKYRALLTADQRTYVISIASIVYVALNTAAGVALSLMHVDIVLMRAAILVTIVSRTVILLRYCRRHYGYIDYKADFAPNLLDKRWDALFLQILGAIHTGAPVVILTIILKDLKLVSVYTIYNMVLNGVGGILGVFVSGLSSSFGDVIARGQTEVLRKTYQEFECFYYSLLSVVYSVMFVMIMPFISIYTRGISDVNYNIPILGFLFTLNGLMYNLKTPQGMLVISAGMYKETKWQTSVQGAIAVAGGVMLAIPFGIEGLLIASILSNLYRDIDLMFFIPKHLTGLPVISSFLRIIRIFINVVTVVVMSRLLFGAEITNYLQWTLYALFTMLLSVAVTVASALMFDRERLFGVLIRF